MDAPIKRTPAGAERRQSPRAKIVRPVRIRTDSPDLPMEIKKTRDISKTGFFFISRSPLYHVGMRIYVVMGYEPGDPESKEWLGEVARIEKLPGDNFGIGVRIVLR